MSTDECGTKLQFSSAPRPCAIAGAAAQASGLARFDTQRRCRL